MAKFVFKLQPLLNHRRRLEDQRQLALAQLLRQRLAIETHLRSQQEAIGSDKRTMAGALTGQVDVERIRRHAATVNRAVIGAQQAAFRLVELTRQIDQARSDLADAVRQRKAVEVLRDRYRRRWEAEQKRREAGELDELATQRYRRGTNAGSPRAVRLQGVPACD